MAVAKWLCTVATDACRRAAPPLPAGRKKGPAFKEIDEQELNMQRMMASMQARQCCPPNFPCLLPHYEMRSLSAAHPAMHDEARLNVGACSTKSSFASARASG